MPVSTAGPHPGLSEVATKDLLALAALLSSEKLRAPLSPMALDHAGLGHLQDALHPIGQLDANGIILCIQMALAERNRGQDATLELIWSGPDSGQSFVQFTRPIVIELVDSARTDITIAGYSFDQGAGLFEALHRARNERGVAVRFFLDIVQLEARITQQLGKAKRRERLKPLENAKIESPESYAREIVAMFLEEHWPATGLKPEVFYDPRSADPKSFASLHAKCLIVDHERALITSANFTDRGQSRNIEVGVRIRDKKFARELERQWNNLIDSKDVVRG